MVCDVFYYVEYVENYMHYNLESITQINLKKKNQNSKQKTIYRCTFIVCIVASRRYNNL